MTPFDGAGLVSQPSTATLWRRAYPHRNHPSGIILGVFPTGPGNPAEQWRRAGRWAVDLEGQNLDDGYFVRQFRRPKEVPSPHVERSFRTEAEALAFARFLEWCVDGLTDEQLVECARVTDGRLL